MNKKMTANMPMKRKATTVMMMAVVPILFLVRVVTTFPQYGHWKLDRGCSPKVAVTRAVLWGTALTYKHAHSAIDRRTHACTHARTVTHTHTHTWRRGTDAAYTFSPLRLSPDNRTPIQSVRSDPFWLARPNKDTSRRTRGWV